MKVYVTKYWGTQGIYPEMTDEEYGTDNRFAGYVYVGERGRVHTQLKLGKDAFEQLPDAVKYCNEQVIKKKLKTEKELQRLKSLYFTTKRLRG